MERRIDRKQLERTQQGQIYIGTSGYSYKGWEKTFYPRETPKRLQLEYYANHFSTVEINSTFYRLPSEKMVNGWRDRVGEEFVYTIKGSRFITHMKKLVNLGPGLDRFFDRLEPMRHKIEMILWQLPGILKKDIARLEDFLPRLPGSYNHSMEFRDRSWLDDPVFDLLHKYRIAHVSLSTLNMPANFTVTSHHVYLRFHGLEGGMAHDYTAEELKPWAEFASEQAKRSWPILITM
ncbi:MAG: DUF72 domain-containing protein [Verrucomicrobiota bacterium]|nr:DUF72 domain-containing protein [Verrucomicrobiota bacterium]